MSGNYATPPPQSATQETTLGQSNGFVDGSYPCGSIFGIPLRVHKLFVAYIVIVSVLGFVQGGLEGNSELGFMLFLVNGPILFGTVLIHELGHCWATYRIGGMVEGILLWPLGGLAFIGHSGEAKEDLFVSVAGPLTHIPQMIVWVILLAASADGDATLNFSGAFFADLCRHAIVINLSLFLFNLFCPAYPLDGGRILVSCMLLCGVPVGTTANITVAVSAIFGLLIICLGAVYLNFLTISSAAGCATRRGSCTRSSGKGGWTCTRYSTSTPTMRGTRAALARRATTEASPALSAAGCDERRVKVYAVPCECA